MEGNDGPSVWRGAALPSCRPLPVLGGGGRGAREMRDAGPIHLALMVGSEGEGRKGREREGEGNGGGEGEVVGQGRSSSAHHYQ